MLLLNTDQVQFCQVSNPEVESDNDFDALIYLNRLFIKGESFSPDQQNQALSRTQELLDSEEEVWGVLLKEESGFSLWYCSGEVHGNQYQFASLVNETDNNSTQNTSETSETKTESQSNQQQPKLSRSILNRLRKEWENSFRLSN